MSISRNIIIQQILPSATLAPSAHNTQPWRFGVNDNTIDVYADPARHLEVSDPTRRELYLSLGCAITNILVAAAHEGLVGTIEYFPQGSEESKPAAHITFEPGQPNQHLAELYEAISKRRTNRTLYDGEPLTEQEKAALKGIYNSHGLLIEDRQQIAAIGGLAEAGTRTTLARADFKKELSHWVRHNWTKQPDGMPGYAMGMPAPLSLIAAFMIRVAPIHKQEAPKSKKEIVSASAVAVIATEGDTAEDHLKAGQLLEQLWLEATAVGLAAMPAAAAVEASEASRQQLQQALRLDLNPQAILRIGHSAKKNLRATPRRSVADCLK